MNQPARVPARPRRGVVGSILATLGLVLAKAKGAAFLLLGKLKLVLVLGLKLVKLGTFGWTMLLAAWLYAGMYGWRFGVGLVLLTLIHECGHVAAARWLGLPVSAPVFIPFFGAYVKLRHLPRSSWENFLVSVGGPLLGAVASGLCVLASTGAGERLAGLLLVLGYYGLVMNLFNLMPFGFLDGAHAIVPIPWRAGVVASAFALALLIAVAAATHHLNPVPLLAIVGAGGKLWWRGRSRQLEVSRIPDTASEAQRLVALAVYFGLIVGLTLAVQVLPPLLP